MQYQPVEPENYPGYHIRRLQQIAVALFMEETEEYDITPVQYAALSAIHRHADTDQKTLSRLIGLDTSTTGSVVNRLELRQLITRSSSPSDKRVRLLKISAEGIALLQVLEPLVLRAQSRILHPLSIGQRVQFMEMLSLLLHENDDLARAPSAMVGQSAEYKRSAAVQAVKFLIDTELDR